MTVLTTSRIDQGVFAAPDNGLPSAEDLRKSGLRRPTWEIVQYFPEQGCWTENVYLGLESKLGDHIRSITIDQISFFYADGRDVYLVTDQLRKFIIDYTLEGLEEVLDHRIFYRLNRTYIVNISAIQDVVVYSNSRLKITLKVKWEHEIIVSREKVGDFKDWFDGEH